MKSEVDLSLLARQWGASAVPFGLVNGQDWLETPGAQRSGRRSTKRRRCVR
jgi:hypothetical protein